MQLKEMHFRRIAKWQRTKNSDRKQTRLCGSFNWNMVNSKYIRFFSNALDVEGATSPLISLLSD